MANMQGRHVIEATQENYPWQTIARTLVQALVGLAASWGLIVEALGLDPGVGWVATSLAVTAAVTRFMAVPQVNAWLAKYIPWLAPEGGLE